MGIIESFFNDFQDQERNLEKEDLEEVRSSDLNDVCVTEEESQNVTEEPSDTEDQKKIEEMEILLEQERSLFEERKEQMEKEIERLSIEINVIQKEREKESERLSIEINVIQKDREAETKRWTEETSDLKKINDQQRAEIVRLNNEIESIQANRKAVIKKSTKTINNLRQTNQQLKEEAGLVLDDYEALQKEKEAEKEEANKAIADLREMNDQLQMKMKSNNELEKSVCLLKEDLKRASEQNRAQMEKETKLIRENEALEKKNAEQRQNIKDMSEERQRLKSELEVAHVNDLVRGGRYKALASELEGFKNKVTLLEFELARAMEENDTLKEDLSRLTEVKDHPEETGEQVVVEELNDQVKIQDSEELIEKEVVVCKGRPANKLEKTTEKQCPERDQNNADVKEKDACAPQNVGESHRPQKDASPKREKTRRKLIVFDLEPDSPKMDRSPYSGLATHTDGLSLSRWDNSIIFNGELVPFTYQKEGFVIIKLGVPRKFHRAINGVQGRTLIEFTEKSGGALIQLPSRSDTSDLISVSGTVQQVQLAAGHIEKLIGKFC
ncbi:rho-associated protein kinase 2-like [Macrobrachium nipponense]|uniref:rho-associated protein kinase 2-like n=1 Tax=Macrobrachium nipponense TaxID=159736 RepID=UPI0030C818CC